MYFVLLTTTWTLYHILLIGSHNYLWFGNIFYLTFFTSIRGSFEISCPQLHTKGIKGLVLSGFDTISNVPPLCPFCPPCFPPLPFAKAGFLPYPSDDGGLWLLLLFLFKRSVSSLTLVSNSAIFASFNMIIARRVAFSSSNCLIRNSSDANLSSMVNFDAITNTFYINGTNYHSWLGLQNLNQIYNFLKYVVYF